MNRSREKFGPQFASPPGYIAAPGGGPFKHRFGGASWELEAPGTSVDVPVLVAVLDGSDPFLATLGLPGTAELPLFSFLNCDAWLSEQAYAVDFNRRRATLLSSVSGDVEMAAPEDRLPSPLPETPLSLRPMAKGEYPVDESSYWAASDAFLGGDSILRVLGAPLWLDFPAAPPTIDGRPMQFVMALGYENWNGPFRFMPDRPLFIGEAALYWYFDRASHEIRVISQAT